MYWLIFNFLASYFKEESIPLYKNINMASSVTELTENKTDPQCSAIENKDFFRQWLSGKLKYYNADEEVFLPYIMSIVEEAECDSTESDEVLDSLSDVLEGLGLEEENEGKANKILALY